MLEGGGKEVNSIRLIEAIKKGHEEVHSWRKEYLN